MSGIPKRGQETISSSKSGSGIEGNLKKTKGKDMDTMTATTASGVAAELKQQINGLYRRKGELEGTMQREHVMQEKLAARRKELVGELPSADSATEAWAHSEIDATDNALKLSIRTAEGLQITLTKLFNEIGAAERQLAEATRIIVQAEREQGLRRLEIQLQEDRQTAEAALASVRLALVALNATASRGIEEFGGPAQNLVKNIAEEFRHREVNPESLGGWRDARPNFLNLQFTVRPMVKDAVKR
jgi:hypothetical protein